MCFEICGLSCLEVKRCNLFPYCCSTVNVIVANHDVKTAADAKETAMKTLGSAHSFTEAITQENINTQELGTRIQKIHFDGDDLQRHKDVIVQGMRSFGHRCVTRLSNSSGQRSERLIQRNEGLERFKFACQLCSVNFEKKEERLIPLFAKEQKIILKKVKEIQEYGSFAAHLWSLYKTINPNSKERLNDLKRDGVISKQVFNFFKNLINRNNAFVLFDNFSQIAFEDKKRFLEAAKKIKALAEGCLSCFCHTKEVSELGNDFFNWSTSSTTKKHSRERVSFDGAMLSSFELEQKENEENDLSGVGLSFSFSDYVKRLSNNRSDLKELGKKRLKILASRLKISLKQIDGQLTAFDIQRLEKGIKEMNSLTGVMFHLFKAFKETQDLKDVKKVNKLKKTHNIKGKKLAKFNTITQGKRNKFFKAIEKAQRLEDLSDGSLLILYFVALEFSENEENDLNKTYSLQDWKKCCGKNNLGRFIWQ